MTPPYVRKKAFEYERNNPDASLSQAWMQGYLFAQSEEPAIFVDDVPQKEYNDYNKDEFDVLWVMYDRKDNKQGAIKAWKKLSRAEKNQVFEHVPAFVHFHKDKKFRPMLATYLNQKRFTDEEIIGNGESTNETAERLNSYAEAISNIK